MARASSRCEARSLGVAATAFLVASPPHAAFASLDPNDMTRFKKALEGVNYLLDNWDAETTPAGHLPGGGHAARISPHIFTHTPFRLSWHAGLQCRLCSTDVR